MRITCNNKHFFEGAVSKIDGKWQSVCHKCGEIVTVYVPDANMPIFMAWADDRNPEKDKEVFTDNWEEKNVLHIEGFNTPEEFMTAWRKAVENPKGMWYWVVHNGICICSGACDPMDEEGFAHRFGFEYPKHELIPLTSPEWKEQVENNETCSLQFRPTVLPEEITKQFYIEIRMSKSNSTPENQVWNILLYSDIMPSYGTITTVAGTRNDALNKAVEMFGPIKE